jgi:hypothetical protein
LRLLLLCKGHLLPNYPSLFIDYLKSSPCIFSTHFCCSFDDNLCTKNYFRKSWSVSTLKYLPMIYCHHIFITCKIVVISFSYVDFTKSFPLNCLLSKANGLPSCVNTAPIPFHDAPHSTMNVLPKSSVANTGVEDMASFKSENSKVASSIRTNDFFFKRDVSRPTMRVQCMHNS